MCHRGKLPNSRPFWRRRAGRVEKAARMRLGCHAFFSSGRARLNPRWETPRAYPCDGHTAMSPACRHDDIQNGDLTNAPLHAVRAGLVGFGRKWTKNDVEKSRLPHPGDRRTSVTALQLDHLPAGTLDADMRDPVAILLQRDRRGGSTGCRNVSDRCRGGRRAGQRGERFDHDRIAWGGGAEVHRTGWRGRREQGNERRRHGQSWRPGLSFSSTATRRWLSFSGGKFGIGCVSA